MAIFAELDQDKIVIRRHVIGDDIPTTDGPLGENDMHVDGEEYCRALFNIHKVAGFYKQTSPTASFRGKTAQKGDTYDPVRDKFISQQPFPSWTLNEEALIWQAPTPPPIANNPSLREYTHDGATLLYDLQWDEDNLRWQGVKTDGSTSYWNNDTSTWTGE
jgi:hypothetical protein